MVILLASCAGPLGNSNGPDESPPAEDTGDPDTSSTTDPPPPIGPGPGLVGLVDSDGDGSPLPDDCDDADPTVYPGAFDQCDTIDQDCDGLPIGSAACSEPVAINGAAIWLVSHPGLPTEGSFLVGDITGDGISDLQVRTYLNYTIFPGGTLPTQPLLLPTEGYHSLTDISRYPTGLMYSFEAGDVDGDGLDDLGVLTDTPDAGLHLFLAPFAEGGWTSIADPHIQFEPEDPESSDALWAMPTYGALNLDGDGRADILVNNKDYYGDWAYSLYFGGELDSTCLFGEGGGIVVVGDLDGDGLDDLGLSGDPSGFMSGADLRTACGGLLADAAFADLALEERWTSLATVGDWNGDGWNDLAISDSTSDTAAPGAGEVFFFTGPYGGTLSQADAVGSWTGQEYGDNFGYRLGALDFDGDGIRDVNIGAGVCRGGQFPGPHELRPNCLLFDAAVEIDYRRTYDVDADGFDDFIYEDEDKYLTGIFRGFEVPWEEPTYW